MDLVDGSLPEGGEWLDHLDLLDAIRIIPISNLKPFGEYYSERMPGYLASGAPIGSPRLPFVVDDKPLFGPNLLIPHELRAGYLRFAVATTETLGYSWPGSDDLHSKLTKQATDRLGFGTVDPELIDLFLQRLRLRPTLAKIEEWWAQIPYSMQVTGAGRVLARSNALRLDTRGVLPPID